MHRIFILCVLWTFTGPLLPAQSLFEEAQEAIPKTNSNQEVLSGFVRSMMYLGQDQADNTLYGQSVYSQFGLIADLSIGNSGAAYAELRYRYGSEYGSIQAIPELREGYVDIYLGPARIRTGKQILSWGATSFINPTDQFSAMDPGFRSPDPDDLRIGTWTLDTRISINSNSSLQLLWIPIHSPSKLLTENFTFPEYIMIRDPESINVTIENSAFGIKYDLRTSYFDFEVSYYNGFRNQPSIEIDTLIYNLAELKPEQFSLKKSPYRIKTLGFNLTIPLSEFLIRTECAWLNLNNADLQTYTPFSELTYVAEIEQSGTNVSLIAGYSGKHILDFVAPDEENIGLDGDLPELSTLFPPGSAPDLNVIDSYILKQIQGFNRLYTYQNESYYHSVYTSLSVNIFHEVAEFELAGMYNFTSQELSLFPSMSFNVSDGLSLQMGGYFLKGPQSSLYNMAGKVLNAGYVFFQYLF